MTLDAFTGAALALAGFLLLLREILLSPLSRTFPCAPLVVRAAMFGSGAMLIWVGMLFFGGHRTAFAGAAASPVAFLAAALVVYQGVLFLNLFNERRPPRVWERRRRIDAAAGFGPARTLARAGW